MVGRVVRKPARQESSQADQLARAIRAASLRMTHRARASHVGSCLSIADLLAVLYSEVLQVDPAKPDAPQRDRFILSKGHAAAALYAALAHRGFFPLDWLEQYCQPGSLLAGHASHHGVPGVEVSTGSLGHGLGIGCGMALAAKRRRETWRTFVLLSDGECDEGSIWEAALFAAHHRLNNLIAIIDCNGIQSLGHVAEVLELEPLADKWRAFNWQVREIDGHDIPAISRALHGAGDAITAGSAVRPTLILARTIKGKGVSFMEGELVWHYRNPDALQLAAALKEVIGEAGVDSYAPPLTCASASSISSKIGKT